MTQTHSSPLSLVWNDVLRGDLATAKTRANDIDETLLSSTEKRKLALFLDRVTQPTQPHDNEDETLPEPILTLLRIYRTYWRDALMSGDYEQEEQKLFLALQRAFHLPITDSDSLTSRLRTLCDAHQLHVLTGRTLPLQELILWRTTTTQHFPITLPLTTTTLPVRMLSGFVSRGWAYFCTANTMGAGGWVEDDALCCIEEAWDVSSDAFQTSYLAHEGQHHYDRTHLPHLEQPELEYRAKLAELILSQERQSQILRGFIQTHALILQENRTPRRNQSPHLLGEYWLIEDLQRYMGRDDLSSIEQEDIRKAALSCLQQSEQDEAWRGCPEREELS